MKQHVKYFTVLAYSNLPEMLVGSLPTLHPFPSMVGKVNFDRGSMFLGFLTSGALTLKYRVTGGEGEMCLGGGAPLIPPFTPSRRLKKELPSSFQSIQAKREDLYLVTETVKIAKTETLKCKKQLSFQILLELSDLQYESKVRISGDRDCGQASLAHPLQVRGCQPRHQAPHLFL